MNRLASLVLLVGGVVLLIYAVDAYRSAASAVSRLFTGAPPDKVLWMMGGAVLAIAAGLMGLSRRGV